MKILTKVFSLILVLSLFSGCARDLSQTTYTSDSSLNIVLHGKVLTSRKIKIKESDRIEAGPGALLGGAGAGLAVASSGHNSSGAVAGAALGGAALGAVAQHALGTSKGMEYIVQVDTSKLSKDYYEGSSMMRNALAAIRASGIVTVIQGKESKNDPKIVPGQNVLVIISDKRTRVVPNNN